MHVATVTLGIASGVAAAIAVVLAGGRSLGGGIGRRSAGASTGLVVATIASAITAIFIRRRSRRDTIGRRSAGATILHFIAAIASIAIVTTAAGPMIAATMRWAAEEFVAGEHAVAVFIECEQRGTGVGDFRGIDHAVVVGI